MDKLKPCPFCGSQDVHIVEGIGNTPVFWVHCPECGAEQDYTVTRDGAIKKWNKRSVPVEADYYQAAYNEGYADGYDNAIEYVTEMLKNCPPCGGAHKQPGEDPEKEGNYEHC